MFSRIPGFENLGHVLGTLELVFENPGLVFKNPGLVFGNPGHVFQIPGLVFRESWACL